MHKQIAVVGAGWSGAVVARELTDAGFHVELFERGESVGGHARVERLNGVVYEPNGAHIFHTSNPHVAKYVMRHGLTRPYEHCVAAAVYLHEDDEVPVLLSWPPQVSELQSLSLWPTIEKDLALLPPRPHGKDFESYVISMMGPTLYDLFIRDYTTKQWGCEAGTLSSNFAPKRVELRYDGYRRLFRDRWEFFGPEGVNPVIESILRPVAVTCGATIRMEHFDDLGKAFAAVVITGPLDDFLSKPGDLAWRGISMRSRYILLDDEAGTATPGYVVNHPTHRVPYTRTVETKHATGQLFCGTVVSEEYPGADARHYPVPTVEGENEARNQQLKDTIRSLAPLPVFFCGRLANYCYINQDQAIEQAFACATEVAQLLA